MLTRLFLIGAIGLQVFSAPGGQTLTLLGRPSVQSSKLLTEPRIVLTDCRLGQAVTPHEMKTGGSNEEGYQTMREFYTCKEALIEMRGRWSETIQNGYLYRYAMGRMEHSQPEFVGDPGPNNPLIFQFQKWCPQTVGTIKTYELCGTK